VAKLDGVAHGKGKPAGVLEAALGGRVGDDGFADAADEQLFDEYPILSTFLTRSKDDRGEKRLTSSLMFFTEDGRFRACLHERTKGLSLWTTSDTFKGCLRTLEDRLASGEAEWRKDRKGR
jgi:hypothetical protein